MKSFQIIIAIFAFIVLCVVIKIVFFSSKKNDSLPTSQPTSSPTPTVPIGYYEVTNPKISVNLSLEEGKTIGFTMNFPNNYTLIQDDIGPQLNKASFSIMKCQVGGKYATVKFPIDSVNLLDLSNYTIEFTDTFYVNNSVSGNDNFLMGSLFLDPLMILSVVLSINPQVLSANYIDKKVVFDIAGNTMQNNIIINNFNQGIINPTPKNQYFIHLPQPISLKINSQNYNNQGLILKDGNDITVNTYDSSAKLFLTQSYINNNNKIWFLSPDNTFTKYLKKSTCSLGQYPNPPSDCSIVNFPSVLTLSEKIDTSSDTGSILLISINNTFQLATLNGGQIKYFVEILPFPNPATTSVQNSIEIDTDPSHSFNISLFLSLGVANLVNVFEWSASILGQPKFTLYPDNLGNYILGNNRPIYFIGDPYDPAHPEKVGLFYQFNFVGLYPDLGNALNYYITGDSKVNVKKNNFVSGAIGTVFLDVITNQIQILFADKTVVLIVNSLTDQNPWPFFKTTTDVDPDNDGIAKYTLA